MKRVLFTMGLPGAGKSKVLNTVYVNHLNYSVLIDPDEIKKEKLDYDPKAPHVYHEWSKAEARKRMYQAIANDQDLVIDGTGTNVEKMVKWIRDFQAAGYEVEIVYVQVSVATAIKRNANRMRVVPESLIREKAETISVAFELISQVADVVKIVNND